MEDIEKIELIIDNGDRSALNNSRQASYLRAIAKTQLLVLKELRELRK